MKTFRQFVNWIKDSKGVATSLIEATATVAVGAVLAGVAVGGAIDAINDSKVQAAIGDVSSIGQGVITFYKDNAFFPLFTEGNLTGPGDRYYGFLVSENGTYPTDTSTGNTPTIGANGVIISPGAKWGVTAGSPWNITGFFGDKPDYTSVAAGLGTRGGHATIEGHLIKNVLGDPAAVTAGVPAAAYVLRGSYVGDPERGWAGPYISSLPKTDPWGNKYMINIQYLNSGFLSGLPGATPGNLPKIAVIVLSAGPNRNIETNVDQPFNSFTAQGDDIIFRIK
jgi:hypothetical protein